MILSCEKYAMNFLFFGLFLIFSPLLHNLFILFIFNLFGSKSSEK